MEEKDTQETPAPASEHVQTPETDQELNSAEDVSSNANDLGAITATPETAADTPGELRVAEEAAAVEGDAEVPPSEMTPEQLLIDAVAEPVAEAAVPADDARRLAVLEAIVYVTDEPLSVQQIATALGETPDEVRRLLEKLTAEYNRPEHGLTVKEIAGGYKMATKPEHHEAVRSFVKNLNPPLKLSMAALETLAVIAYKQPITAPEIMDVRGVQGAGVLKTLLDRKLITTSGRKQVVGKPILYKTTKDFLVQFGLKDLTELPTLKEFEDLKRMAFAEEDMPTPEGVEQAPAEESGAPAEATPETVAVENGAEPEAVPAECAPTEAEVSVGEHATAHEGGSGED